jgi:hypothetical protein
LGALRPRRRGTGTGVALGRSAAATPEAGTELVGNRRCSGNEPLSPRRGGRARTPLPGPATHRLPLGQRHVGPALREVRANGPPVGGFGGRGGRVACRNRPVGRRGRRHPGPAHREDGAGPASLGAASAVAAGPDAHPAQGGGGGIDAPDPPSARSASRSDFPLCLYIRIEGPQMGHLLDDKGDIARTYTSEGAFSGGSRR